MNADALDNEPSPLREVRYKHSRDFLPILKHIGSSLLISTYHAGKIVVVSACDDSLRLAFHNFDQPMGMAVGSDRIAIGTRRQLWTLHAAAELAPQVPPAGQHDACFLSRKSLVTGNIHVHELAWSGRQLWVVNTLFSALCTAHEDFSFVPRWQPPFISKLAAEDRCHLNGLAMKDGRPGYVTALSETDTPEGWRPNKATTGCLIDVDSGQTIARGFAMPHSPRFLDGRLFVLNSGQGQLGMVDPANGRYEALVEMPGYTRGLSFFGQFAFIGLSKIRETAVFGGLPLQDKHSDLRCGVGVVDMVSGRSVAYLEFESGVDEIFDVQVLPQARLPALNGPNIVEDEIPEIWLVPNRDQITTLDQGRPVSAAMESTPSTATHDPRAVKHFNQGNAHLQQERYAEAEASYHQVLRTSPNLAIAHCHLATACQYQLRFDEARQHLETTLRIDPGLVDAHVNLSKLCLLGKQWEQGWREYEWRWWCEGFAPKPPAADLVAPRWDGSSLSEKTVLVYGEQGVGDEIMFASCYGDLMEHAKRCVLVCRERLAPLLARSFPGAEIHLSQTLEQPQQPGRVKDVNVQIASGSLPLYLRTTTDSFAPRESYLVADPEKLAKWQNRFAELGKGLKVGISWRGGAGALESRRRSIALERLRPLLEIPGAHFVSLQYGDCKAELNSARDRIGAPIHAWSDPDPLRDIDGFAAQIAALDLVVSIDNSTVHLAGALGVPTWMLTPLMSETGWRWGWGQQRTVWYASLRIFRQPELGDWNTPLMQIAAELRQRAESVEG